LSATEPVAGRLPVVAVVGRPNVGKSSLVNRVVGRRVAVTEETPGVTRDRLEIETAWTGLPFVIVDTGGWTQSGDRLDTEVSLQAQRALEAADLILLVVDVTVGVTAEDEFVARVVRRGVAKRGQPVLVVANKVDNAPREADAWEFVSLGLGDPLPVSALHGRRSGDLLDEVVERLRASTATDSAGGSAIRTDGTGATETAGGAPIETDGAVGNANGESLSEVDDAPAVAIVGRPNVGKSTLFNRLIGEERAVVHDLPGTTRDAIDTLVETPEGSIRFVDTAGMRRKARTAEGPEYFATLRALRALDRADVALLVIDAADGVSHQDQRLAERIAASGSPVVVVLNKWDLVEREERHKVTFDVGDRLAFLGESPVLKVSALTGLGVHRITRAVSAAVEAYRVRIPTGELNRAMKVIQAAHPAPGRIRYAVQGATDPPTITLFANRRLPPTYLRYIERSLRERFDIGPTPIKLRVQVGS
jgi:GTPase